MGINCNLNMDYIRNYVSGHFQPKIWIPDIICLLEALTSNSYTIQDALGPYVNPLCIMTPTWESSQVVPTSQWFPWHIQILSFISIQLKIQNDPQHVFQF